VTDVVDLLGRMVAIDSVNPDLIAGAAGEAELARFVAEWAARAGLDAELHEAAPGRPNAIVTARGTGGGRTLLLNGHLDTVGVEGMDAPFEPRIEGGRMYGRGAYDMKAGVAAALVATVRAHERALRGDVVVAAVADEEYRSIGAERAAERLRADAAIVTEPTDLRLGLAHRGFVWLELEVEGRAAHGSMPAKGVDAIVHMGRVLTRLERLDVELQRDARHPLLGGASIHASTIEGGREWSMYPDRCILRVERRTLPDEDDATVESQVRALLDGVRGSVTTQFVRHAHEVPEDAEIVEMLRRHDPDTSATGFPFWTDAAVFGAAGIPTVLYGPGGDGAHAAVEWVDLEQVERCADVLTAVATDFCA
jgi:acetylornithine deacetylase